MGKVSKANTYFLIIMLLQLFLPVSKIFEIFNITDIKLMLFINHSIIFIIPAFCWLDELAGIFNTWANNSVFKCNLLSPKTSNERIVSFPSALP